MEGQGLAPMRISTKWLGGSCEEKEERGKAGEVGMWDVRLYSKSSGKEF